MKNIRNIRKEKKMTLEGLSAKTGYTIGYLSQIERQLRTPTLNTLRKIAFAFDLDVTDLLYEYEENKEAGERKLTDDCYVVKKEDRSALVIPELDLTYEIIIQNKMINGRNCRVKAMICKLKPGDKGTGSLVKHTTDEFILVQKGIMCCETGTDKITLTEGDSMLIPAGCTHMFRNVSKDTTAEILMIMR